MATLRRTHRIVGNLAGALPEHPRQSVQNGLPLVLMPEEVRLLVEQLHVAEIVEGVPVDFGADQFQKRNQQIRSQYVEEITERARSEKRRQLESNLDRIVAGRLRKQSQQVPMSADELAQYRERTLEELLASKVAGLAESEILRRFSVPSPFGDLKPVRPFQLAPLPAGSLESLKHLAFSHLWHKGYYLSEGMKFGAHYLAYDHDPTMFHAKFIVICLPGGQQEMSRFNRSLLQAYGRLGKNVRKNVLIASFDDHQAVQFRHFQWNPAPAFSPVFTLKPPTDHQSSS